MNAAAQWSDVARRLACSGLALALLCGGLLPSARAQDDQAGARVDDHALALHELETGLSADPDNTVLRYEYARTLARAGATDAALAEFDRLLVRFPDDADYLLGRAQMQARLGQHAGAIETAEHALRVAPNYEDVWQLRLQLAEQTQDAAAVAALRAEAWTRFPAASWWRSPPAAVEYRRWLSSGFSTERLSNGASDWNTRFLRVDWQTSDARALFAELSHGERFEEPDVSLSVGGAWQALPKWRAGAAIGLTGDAQFMPERELAADATRAWGQGWGTTFGVRQRDYSTGDVSSLSFTGEKYIADYRLAYRLDHSRLAGADSALTHSLSLVWYANDRRNFGVTLGAGEEIESIGLGRLLHTSVANITFTGSQTLSARLSLNWWLGAHEQGDFYRRDYAGLSVRIGL